MPSLVGAEMCIRVRCSFMPATAVCAKSRPVAPLLPMLLLKVITFIYCRALFAQFLALRVAVTRMRLIVVNPAAPPSSVITRRSANGESLRSARYRIRINFRLAPICTSNRKCPGSRSQRVFLHLKRATISRPFGLPEDTLASKSFARHFQISLV